MAISKRGGWRRKKIANLVKVSVNTMPVSKALVFEDCSEPQTDLKTIIGTGTEDRLRCGVRPRWE